MILQKRYFAAIKNNTKAFTLIELLVVISIIALLMSILLPSLTNAREAGKDIVCRSNMKQLSLAWMFYCSDNDDFLCSPDTLWNDGRASDNQRNHWAADGEIQPSNYVGGTKQAVKDGVLYSYTQETLGLYKCKSDATTLVRSYSISNTMGGYNCGCGNMTNPFTNLSQITKPTGRLVFIDTDSIQPDWEPKWIAGGFWPLSDINPETARWAIPSYNNITARHRGGCNMTFADMHCERYRWRDRRTVRLANWNFYQGNTVRDNLDLMYMLEILKGPQD